MYGNETSKKIDEIMAIALRSNYLRLSPLTIHLNYCEDKILSMRYEITNNSKHYVTFVDSA